MSMRLVMVGYMLSLVAAILGCIVISRGRKEVRGLNWLIGTLSAALVGSMLLYSRFRIPDFFSIIVANEAMLASLVLLHQAIAAILGSSRRCLWLSMGVAGALFAAFLHYTYVSDDLSARVLARTAAVIVQILISIVVLFRHKDPVLRSPIRVALWALVAYCTMQITRFILTLIWPPSPDLMHPDAVQAFFSFVNCIMGLSICSAVLWLALWSQRHELQIMAFSDVLTGLMNRRAFDEIVECEMRGHRRGEPLVLLLIDIDSFKAINDDYGHLAGDEVIRQVGRVLQANSRADDTVSRYGGEEFVMLLRDLRLDRAEAIAERLRMQVAGIGGLPEAIGVTVSIGLAVHGPGDTFASLLKRSDDALYCAKRSGRNRVSMVLA
jgi:diguanylate cyclase (GGDEF)-like protein